jgi:hypothetical protein
MLRTWPRNVKLSCFLCKIPLVTISLCNMSDDLHVGCWSFAIFGLWWEAKRKKQWKYEIGHCCSYRVSWRPSKLKYYQSIGFKSFQLKRSYVELSGKKRLHQAQETSFVIGGLQFTAIKTIWTDFKSKIATMLTMNIYLFTIAWRNSTLSLLIHYWVL